jgi:hypothetical protein
VAIFPSPPPADHRFYRFAGGQTWPTQTLLGNARWSISNVMGVGFTRGMASVASILK